MLEKSREDSRLDFRWRTCKLDCRAWMPGKYAGARACPHCPAGSESQEAETGEHWLTKAYSELRQGINPELCSKDILKYLWQIQLVRLELEK